MIASVFGLPSLTILELADMLNSCGVTYGVVGKTSLAKMSGPDCIKPVPVIFPSMRVFLRTKHKFKTSPITALVVDCPYVLNDTYKVPLLGAAVENHKVVNYEFGTNLLMAALTGPPNKYEFKEPYIKDYVAQVLTKHRGSSLAGLQTLLYKIKDRDTRACVNAWVRKYFVDKASLRAVSIQLDSLIEGKVRTSLIDLLSSQGCQNLRLAIQLVRANPTKLKYAADKFKVSPFDVKYMLSSK